MTIEKFIEARIAERQASLQRTHGGRYRSEDYLAERLREYGALRVLLLEHHISWHSRACPYCGGKGSAHLGCAGPDAGQWECATCAYQYIEGEFGQPSPTAGGCRTLRIIATAWSDHKDYDKGWAL